MNIWIKRSLATVAVTGGIVIAGAATAQADEQHSSNESDTSFSSPIELGGLSLGSTSESSSSSSSTSSSSDGGETTKHHDSSHEQSSNGGGIEVEPSRIDLAGALSNSSSQQDEDHGDADSSSSSSETSGSASAPIELGGVQVHQHQASESKDESSSTSTDGDESHTEHQASSDASSSEGHLDTGGVSVDPHAAFGSSQEESDSSVGDGGTGESTSGSDTEGSAGAPVHVEGLTGAFSSSSSSADESSSTTVDGDESHTEEHASTDHQSTGSEFGGGGLALDPHGSFGQQQSESSSTLGDDVELSDSASSSTFEAGAPYVFEGFWGELWTTSDTTSTDTAETQDGDESTSITESQASHDDTTVAGHSGPAAGDPSLGFLTEQAESSAESDFADGDTSSSESSTSGGYDAPFAYDGFGGLVEHGSADHHATSDTVRDGDEVHTDEQASHDESRNGQELGLDGFSGHPEGWFSTADLEEILADDAS